MSKILDVCCGSKMFWFDKNNKNVVFMDIRELDDILYDCIALTEKLGFSFDEIYEGYIEKNKENYERMKRGY